MDTDPRIDAYLAGLPRDQAEALERLRQRIRLAAPDAVETISYGMPAFKLGRQFLVSFAAWKAHCSIYPLTDSFLAGHRDDLEGFGRTKGSLHFTPDRPLPDELVDGIVRARLSDLGPAADGS